MCNLIYNKITALNAESSLNWNLHEDLIIARSAANGDSVRMVLTTSIEIWVEEPIATAKERS